jgi:hypothetical protein
MMPWSKASYANLGSQHSMAAPRAPL